VPTSKGKPEKKQSERFREMAREIGADEDEHSADTLMGALAKMKPEPRKKPAPHGRQKSD
jgi:hypothetical protein